MSLVIGGYRIQDVKLIDDEPDGRQTMKWPVDDLDLTPIMEDGPLLDLQQFVEVTKREVHAVICDYHLRKRRYARFDGGSAVALLNREKVPAILCTRYDEGSADELRSLRRFIPVIVNLGDLTTDVIQEGFQRCIAEIEGHVPASRRPWKTLVRIEEFLPTGDAEGMCYVIVPGWHPDKGLSVRLSDLPETVRRSVVGGQDHIFAEVNLGAESGNELYFSEWSTD